MQRVRRARIRLPRLTDEPGRHADLVARAPARWTQRCVPRKVQSRPVATCDSGTPPPGRPGISQADGSRPPAHEIPGRTSPAVHPEGGHEPALLCQAASGRNTEAQREPERRSGCGHQRDRWRDGSGLLASRREGRGGQPGVSGRLPGDAASAPPAAPSAPIPPACQPAGPWRRAGPCPKPCSWRGRVRW